MEFGLASFPTDYAAPPAQRAVFWLRSQPLADLEGRLEKCAELSATYRAA